MNIDWNMGVIGRQQFETHIRKEIMNSIFYELIPCDPIGCSGLSQNRK